MRGGGDRGLLRRQQQDVRIDQRDDEEDDRHQEVPARLEHLGERRRVVELDAADAVLGGLEIDVDEQAGVIEDRRDRGGDADRAVGDLQELRHDEGGGAHHRRHELAAGRADRTRSRPRDSGEKPDLIIAGMVTMPTASTFDTALPEIMPNSAEPTTAILAAPPRKPPHRRHCEVGEEVRAAGARQHLAEDRERDDDQHGDLRGSSRSCRSRRGRRRRPCARARPSGSGNRRPGTG